MYIICLQKLDITPFFLNCLLVQCVQTFGVCLHICTSSTLWHQREPVINSEHWPKCGPLEVFRVNCAGGGAAVFKCLHTHIKLPAPFTRAKITPRRLFMYTWTTTTVKTNMQLVNILWGFWTSLNRICHFLCSPLRLSKNSSPNKT